MANSLRLAVNTSIYDGYDMDVVFNSIKKCGFKFFELAYNQGYISNLSSSIFSDQNANYINALKEKYGLSTLALGCTMDLATDGLVDIFEERLIFAHKIGAKYINVCTTKSDKKEKLLKNLISLCPLLKENDTILCLENGGDYNYNAFVTVEDGIALLSNLEKEFYALNFDPGNMVTLNKEIDVVSQSLKSIPYCQYFHVKDVDIVDDKFLFIPVQGKGMIDYATIIPRLKELDIPFSFEIPLRMYRDLDSTPRKSEKIVDLDEIERTLIISREYIENL
ncbi:sugar phosphate isomerase/epimerase family protein [Actinobacillus porcinus]|uniref:sugar phosphate isomerase/epimerase family protein n=1 Tax=Actinobacillus porcinus TaxID=51048 RepID=UPI0023569B42|nr:TIM barrel protein [Actinobacillus porcinus]